MARKEKTLVERAWLEAQGLGEDDIAFLGLLRDGRSRGKAPLKPVPAATKKPVIDWMGNKHFNLKPMKRKR